MTGLYFYIELLPESLGCAPYQVLDIVDKLADQVGNASGGIGDMRAALEDGDTEIRTPPPSLRGSAHASAVTSDHDQSLMRHSGLPPCRFTCNGVKRNTLRECLSIAEDHAPWPDGDEVGFGDRADQGLAALKKRRVIASEVC